MRTVALAVVLSSSLAIAAPPVGSFRTITPEHPPLSNLPQRHPTHHQEIHPPPVPSSVAAEAAHEEEAPTAPIKFWDTKILNNEQPPLWALLFNFALLVFIYYRYGKQPAADALKNRKVSIATAIENAQRILKEAKERSKRYRAKLEKAADDADQAKQALLSTGKGEAELILRNAEEKALRIQRDAKFLLEQEKKQTQLDLLRETVEKAAKDAEDLLRKTVTSADHERLADEFVAKLSKDFENGMPLG
jgi:F-type H+-transporting ATPase subunit b